MSSLTIKKDDLILLNVELTSYNIEDMIFGTDSIKELVFFRYIKNTDEATMEDLFHKIDIVEKGEIYTFIIYYSAELYFIFTGRLKKVFYNIQSYMERKELKTQERLAIRFEEDNEIKISPKRDYFVCDHICPYLQDGYCIKYKKRLIPDRDAYVICQKCFIESFQKAERIICEGVYAEMIENLLNEQKYID